MPILNHLQSFFAAGSLMGIQTIASDYFVECGSHSFIVIHNQHKIRHGQIPPLQIFGNPL